MRKHATCLLWGLFNVYLVLNMGLCSLLFLGASLPRETVSGLTGRWAITGTPWQAFIAICILEPAINRLYFWDADHCRATFRLEYAVRKILYPELGR